MKEVKIGNRLVGNGHPTYIIAEIGINHNGSMENVKKLIDGAVFAGCDAVKFQKRTPELCVPKEQWDILRDTPWGRITYLEYRHKVELGYGEFYEIDLYCKQKGIDWFASCWDEESVDFINQFQPIAFKVASASLTDISLLKKHKSLNKPIFISTGMSEIEEIDKAVAILGEKDLLIAQSTSTYPCSLEELNINTILTYKTRYPNYPIGYSGHETGLAPTYAAVALGANFIERHITLDRAMWGTDQASSVEVLGLFRLVKDIRDIEKSLGDGIKRIYKSELSSKIKLRNSQYSLLSQIA
ncbi:MAG: N-acetylneuraminate synthase family protein [bacterium]